MTVRTLVQTVLLVTAFAAGVACGDLGASLDGAECYGPDDCGPLNCIAPNPDGLNGTAIGWCLEESSCVVGEQPYCPCGLDPASSDPRCDTPYVTGNVITGTVACWDETNMATCLCLPPSVTCKYDPP